MKDIPFKVGEATNFPEDIGMKYFTYLPARKNKDRKKYGSIFSMITDIDNQKQKMSEIIERYLENIEKNKNPRISLKNAIIDSNISFDYFIGILFNKKLYFAFTEGIDVYLLRNEELRLLTEKENDYVVNEEKFHMGEYFVFNEDRISILSSDISKVISLRQIKDIMSEYKEKISAKELLQSAYDNIDEEEKDLFAMTIKINNLKSGLKSINLKPVIFILFILAFAFFVFKFIFTDKALLKNMMKGLKDSEDKIEKVEKDKNNNKVVVKRNMNLPLIPQSNWKKKFEGAITSSPVVYNNHIFIASKDKYIYCYDIQTKKLKWKKFMAYKMGATPFIDNSGLYIGTYKGYFYKLNEKTGKIIWKYNTLERVVSSAIADEKYVYFGANSGFVYSLNKKTGELNWRYRTNNIVWSSLEMDKQNIYIGSLDHNFYGLNKKNGKLKWKKDLANQIYSSPSEYKNKVFIGSSSNNLYCIDKKNGDILWTFGTPSEVASKIEVKNGNVYFGIENGIFYSVKTDDGSLNWKYNTGNHIRSRPKIKDGIIYITSYDKNVYALREKDGALVWKDSLKDSIYSSVGLYKDELFVGDQSGLFKSYETDLSDLKPAKLE